MQTPLEKREGSPGVTTHGRNHADDGDHGGDARAREAVAAVAGP